MKIKFLLIIFILLPLPVKAANSLDIVVNEIAWMGTEAAYQDEWIELYNNTDAPVDLTGWMLKAADGTPEVNLAGTVPANGFYLLERTDDTTVPGITADQIYTGALGNSGENLEFYDNLSNLIDAVGSSSGWFAGDNSTKQTMERTNPDLSGTVPEHWQTGQNPGGTPKSQNSIVEPELEPEPEPVCQPAKEICDEIDNDCDGQIDEDDICQVPSETPVPEDEPEPIVYPSGIFINEFLPSPEGADSEGEWIEFYNSNQVPVNFSDWIIEDGKGVTKSHTFPNGTNIQGYGFLVLDRPASKIVLNNDGEGLLLKNPLGNVVDAVSYDGKAPQGQAFAKKNSGVWEWTLDLTPGEENSFPVQQIVETSEPEVAVPEPEILPKPEPETQETPQESQSYEVEPRKIVGSGGTSTGLKRSPASGKEQTSSPKLTLYPAGVFINEILPSPAGPDAEEEWFEIFNDNNFEADLSGWQIQDTTGRIKTYTFPQETKITPKGYLVLSRPTTKITLNNDGDGLQLIQPGGGIIDQVSYGKAPTDKSYSLIKGKWSWSDALTPGSENIIPSQTVEKAERNKGNKAGIQQAGQAGISQLFPASSQGLFVLLTAFLIALFSGIIIFILKRKTRIE